MASKKTAATKQSAKAAGTKSAGAKAKKSAEPATKSMPKAGKDPAGGLTAKGRAYFAKTEGAHLRPGVQGPADTPEKMVRKGSFLRRHFANPRGPMKDPKGEPTRLALSAHAWGEPVPETMEDAKHLAEEGHELLEQYHAVKDGATTPGKAAAKKSPRKKTAKPAPGRAASGPAGKKGTRRTGK